jgi:PPP family 3-phenylpropionic acid transporter
MGTSAYILLYVALFGAFGVASPFWPMLFDSRGLTTQEISWALAAGMVFRLVAGPLVGRLADATASPRLVLGLSILVAAAAAAAFAAANIFLSVLVVVLVQAAALAPITSIADALTVSRASSDSTGKPLEYGWVRGAASLAFLSGTLIVGQFIAATGLDSIIWLNVGLLLVAAATTVFLPRPVSQAGNPRAGWKPVEARKLLKVPAFPVVIGLAALIYGSHALYDAFAVIGWDDAGLDASVISMLWAEAVAAEVVVFFLVGPWLIGRIGIRGAAVLAATAGIVRWSVMGFTDSVLLLSLLQPLHGLTFALLHLSCMRVFGAVIPAGLEATAQSLYAFGAALVTAVLLLCAGTLYANYGGAAYLSMAALCAVALPLAWYGLTDEALRPRPKELQEYGVATPAAPGS